MSQEGLSSVHEDLISPTSHCPSFGLGWLPLVALLNGFLSLCVPFVISRADHLVHTVLPFISDTGALPPASCWFTLFLNATAYSVLAVSIVRYLQIREHLGHASRQVRIVNTLALAISALACLGLALVAAFQEVNNLTIHMTGALMAFYGGALYCGLQTHLTRLLIRGTFFTHTWLMVIRAILTALILFCCIALQIVMRRSGYTLPSRQVLNDFPDSNATTLAPYTDATFYYASTGCEWTMGVSLFLYIATLTHELSRIEIQALVSTTVPRYTPAALMSYDNME